MWRHTPCQGNHVAHFLHNRKQLAVNVINSDKKISSLLCTIMVRLIVKFCPHVNSLHSLFCLFIWYVLLLFTKSVSKLSHNQKKTLWIPIKWGGEIESYQISLQKRSTGRKWNAVNQTRFSDICMHQRLAEAYYNKSEIERNSHILMY